MFFKIVVLSCLKKIPARPVFIGCRFQQTRYFVHFVGVQGQTGPGRRRTHANEGVQGETREDKGRNGRQGETRPWRRRTHHPYEGAQGETEEDKTSEKAGKPPRRCTRADKTLEKADTPSI